MHRHSTPVMQFTTRGASFRLRPLLDELHLLMGSFPDLRDAFRADGLPLAFILRRDSRVMKDSLGPRGTHPSQGNDSVRRPRISGSQSRGGRRKQMSSE